MRLKRDFYLQDTETVARALLGKRIHKKIGRNTVSGVIVETEAYLGLNDPACHSYHGKQTPRTAPFYKIGGTSYVYLIYGMYYCFNIISGDVRTPEAILVRAIEPDADSIETLRKLRPVKRDKDLTNGPGKLCLAYGIDKSHNSLDLTKDKNIWIEDATNNSTVITKPRIGIDSYGECAKWPLRFYTANNHFVSKI